MEVLAVATLEDLFKALGDPIRIRIVELLAENGEMCVCNIMDRLGMTQPAVSHHLAVLKHAGLVHSRKQCQWVHYSLCCTALADTALPFLRKLLDDMETAPKHDGCCS